MEQYDLTQTGAEVQQILNDVQPAADAATEAYNRANSAINGLQQLTRQVNSMTYQIVLPSQSGAWTGGDFSTLVSTILSGSGRVIDQNGTELSCVVEDESTVSIVRLTGLTPTQSRQTIFVITKDEDGNVSVTVNNVTAGASIVNFITLPLEKTDYQTGTRTISRVEQQLILAVYNGNSIGVVDGMMILSGGGSVPCVIGIESNNGKTYVYRWTQRASLPTLFDATRTELIERGNESYDLDQLNWTADSAATDVGVFKSLYHCTAPEDIGLWLQHHPDSLFNITKQQRSGSITTEFKGTLTREIRRRNGSIYAVVMSGIIGGDIYQLTIKQSSSDSGVWDMEVRYCTLTWQ